MMRIRQAQDSLAVMLRESTLVGKSFLDIGCGSGLFSLAARRQGARVHSFDFDADSVRCARRASATLPPERSRNGHRAGLVSIAIYGALGNFDIVYLLGSPPPHRPDVGSGRRGVPAPSGRRQAVHRALQRFSGPEDPVAAQSSGPTTGCPVRAGRLLTADHDAAEEEGVLKVA